MVIPQQESISNELFNELITGMKAKFDVDAVEYLTKLKKAQEVTKKSNTMQFGDKK